MTRPRASSRSTPNTDSPGSRWGRAGKRREGARPPRAGVCDRPYDGVVGARRPPCPHGTDLRRFRRDVAEAGVDDGVVALRRQPEDVHLDVPIASLLVSGLHDYASVASDFLHFEPHLGERAYVALHDHADYFPG
jgi:hypothetical protein